MTVTKKLLADTPTSYEIEAALHRAKVIANRVPDPNEILPVDGKLYVSLTGKPVVKGTEAAVFGKSRIDIPEFREILKKLPY
jgi:hypothetical protein